MKAIVDEPLDRGAAQFPRVVPDKGHLRSRQLQGCQGRAVAGGIGHRTSQVAGGNHRRPGRFAQEFRQLLADRLARLLAVAKHAEFHAGSVKLRERLADADQRAMARVAMAAMGIQGAMHFFGLAGRQAGRDQEGVQRIVEGPLSPVDGIEVIAVENAEERAVLGPQPQPHQQPQQPPPPVRVVVKDIAGVQEQPADGPRRTHGLARLVGRPERNGPHSEGKQGPIQQGLVEPRLAA